MAGNGTDSNSTVAVFISYVQADNENYKKRITKWFHEELQQLVNARVTEDIRFFLDTEDIGWGEDWEARIRESVESVKLFMPIITTRYFVRDWTRQELKWFLEHEESLGRSDLIVPIYFMDCEEFDQLVKDGDELAEALRRHQLADLRQVRDKMIKSGTTRESQIDLLARRLVEALKRIEAGEASGPQPGVEGSSSQPATGAGKAPCPPMSVEEAGRGGEQAKKREVEEDVPEPGAGRSGSIVVGEDGDYADFADAVLNAPSGSEIVLRPGVHRGGVAIDRTLHIRGEGRRDAIVTAEGVPALICEAATGTIANLTIRCTGSGESAAIEVRAGRPEIEDCTIESIGSGLVAIKEGEPQVRRNLIRGGSEFGISITEKAHGTYEENEITETGGPGIGMLTSASPVVRANRIHQCQDAGIVVMGGEGRPLIEENDISANARAGLYVAGGAAPIARKNQMSEGQDAGIVVTEASGGTFEENEIHANISAGVAIDSNSTPLVRRNRISGGTDVGVYVHDDGAGTIEDNDIFENQTGGVWISTGANPALQHNRIHEHAEAPGVIVRDGGSGVLEDNKVWANGGPGVSVQIGGAPVMRQNRIWDGGHAGVYFDEDAGGELDANDIFRNQGAGVVISGGANPTLRGNQIHDGNDVGVFVREGGAGSLLENEIFGNAVGGMWVDSGGTPVVRANDIRDNEGPGVIVTNGGAGTFEENAIYGNGDAGFTITAEGDPMIVGNRVYGGHGPGVLVASNGRGTIEQNWIFSNASDGIAVLTGGSPIVRGNSIHDGEDTGIFVSQDGAGLIEENDIYRNARAGVWIQLGGNPTLVSNRIHHHRQNGVVVIQGGLGTLRGNQIFQNLGEGVLVGAGCNPVVEENWIEENYSAPLATADPGSFEYYR